MLQITLPDGSKKNFDSPVSVEQIAISISKSLAKVAVAGKVNDNLVDMSSIINKDSKISIITIKDKEGLEILRHSTAHLLAHAVKQLFPDSKYAIGPCIENGFFYDFYYKRSFTPEDLINIENKMLEIAQKKYPIKVKSVTKEQAIDFFKKKNEKYKLEILNDIPNDENITLYAQGDFTDLCRGPHVPNTGLLKIFKLTKISGAYWKSDSKNEMLQRIYGTAWATKDDLKNYLYQIEEAEKRDHRKLGKILDLFHIQEESPGMVFWHPKGWELWLIIEQYLREELKLSEYQEIKTPMIIDRILWEKSGHWKNYKELMFITNSEKRTYAIKPMSCPAHIEVYKKKIHSYKDLPLKLSEFGSCHRNEPSGALHGLLRVRGFVQDDGHIFCTKDQIVDEVKKFNLLLIKVYKKFGFHDISVKLSLRPDKRAGSDDLWDEAEKDLRNALTQCELDWQELEGEGAFYGPKIEYHIKDAIGRSWQCGTLQLDFVLPKRLNAEYVTHLNSKEVPVMLHRAILGSFERFIGILIEHYAGALPLWLSPIQIVIMNINDSQIQYCKQIEKDLKLKGFRVTTDIRNEKIGFKIRENTLEKIPYQIIVGEKEKNENKISVRDNKSNNLGSMTINDFLEIINLQIKVS